MKDLIGFFILLNWGEMGMVEGAVTCIIAFKTGAPCILQKTLQKNTRSDNIKLYERIKMEVIL